MTTDLSLIGHPAGGPPSMPVEVQIAAAEAAARANMEIQARIVHAIQKPRKPMDCRKLLLDECADPVFAEVALYHKPIGKTKNEETGRWEQNYAIDFSVRFVETALQIWGNVDVDSQIQADDIKGVTLRVVVWDVEQNLTFRSAAVVDRTVERRTLPKGRTPRGTRENSFGDTVFVVEATGEEMRNKVGAERSKLIRDWGKRILPRKLLVEARQKIEETMRNEAAEAPDVARRKILDAFGSLGIMPSVLQEYVGQPIEALRADDLVALRHTFTALRDGDITWPELVAMKNADPEPPEGTNPNPPADAKPGSKKDRIMKAAKDAQQETLPGADEAKP